MVSRPDPRVDLAIVVSIILIFIFDQLILEDITLSVLYTIPIALTILSSRHNITLFVTVTVIILTSVAFLSGPFANPPIAEINTFLSIFVILAVAFFVDLGSRVENARLELERRYRDLVESLNEGAWMMDEHLNTTFVNKHLVEMLGYASEDITGKNISMFIRKEEHDRLTYLKEKREKGLQDKMEIALVRKDGGLINTILVTSPIYDDKGRLRGSYASITDITELKRTEVELEEAKSRAELYIDLLTHDISNYNTTSMGYLQLAETKLKLETNESKLITKPLEELRSSSELIANVRDIQRLEAGKENTELIDVCQMLRHIKEEFENQPDREVKIVLNEEHDHYVMASELLRDVFSNIVSNAVKHSSGSLTIGISFNVESQDGISFLRIGVEDNGPGIPDDLKERLFSKSMQGLNKARGHGIGLYLVKRLVEDYGGKVWVEDRVLWDHTKGARFVVMLPTISV